MCELVHQGIYPRVCNVIRYIMVEYAIIEYAIYHYKVYHYQAYSSEVCRSGIYNSWKIGEVCELVHWYIMLEYTIIKYTILGRLVKYNQRHLIVKSDEI